MGSACCSTRRDLRSRPGLVFFRTSRPICSRPFRRHSETALSKVATMTIPGCRKIDCHIHAIDPVRFPYAADTPYRPSGQEIAPAAHLVRVLDVFDVRHALIVGTNSGYGTESRILLDTIKLGEGRFKGVAGLRKD